MISQIGVNNGRDFEITTEFTQPGNQLPRAILTAQPKYSVDRILKHKVAAFITAIRFLT